MTDRLGTLTQTNAGWQLQFVRQLDKPPASVWRAFADPELRKKWFPDTMLGELVPNAELTFASDYGTSFDGKVLDIDEPRLLVLLWGTDELRFELDERDGTTALTLTVSFTEQGKAARDGAGWHECLDHLAALYGGTGARTWGDVHPRYAEHFGPAASTIGPPQEYLDAQRSSPS